MDFSIAQVDQELPSSIDWNSYKKWLYSKYPRHYADLLSCYSRKYFKLLYDAKQIDVIQASNRNNVIKSLIVLSKFLGYHEQFKNSLKNYDIKEYRQNSIESFLRIMKASNSDILDWFNKAYEAARDNEKLFLRLSKITGIRKEEALKAFNLIIQLSKENKLSEYYDKRTRMPVPFQVH